MGKSISSKLADRALVMRCQLGDETAFASLLDRYHRRLRYYVGRLLGSSRNVDDVMQDVWLTVFRRFATLTNPDAFASWAYAIARNKAYHAMRRQPVQLLDGEELEIPADDDGPTFTADDAAEVHRGLEKLQPEHREVLVLLFVEQMSYDEISAVVGCKLGTVKSRIHNAKRKLRQIIKEVNHD